MLHLDPNNSVAFYDRALAYRAIQDHDRAIADLTEAIRLNPRKASAFAIRGNLYLDQRAYELAIADYSEAVSLDPMDRHSFHNRGMPTGPSRITIVASRISLQRLRWILRMPRRSPVGPGRIPPSATMTAQSPTQRSIKTQPEGPK